jgi:hypothetical protein
MTVKFSDWQPVYAEHGIATFPVMITPDRKKPMITNWQKVGMRGSTDLANKFPDATAFGFLCGKRNKVALVDIDSPDEKLLASALDLYGPTPVIIKTGSGKGFHLPYRFNGEPRRIRPNKEMAIDILGEGGYTVAALSIGLKAPYALIEGKFEDFADLPFMRVPANTNTSAQEGPLPSPHERSSLVPPLRDGEGRNVHLYNALRPLALRSAKTEEESRQMAIGINDRFAEPQPLNDVDWTVRSVWRQKIRGTLLVPGCEATALVRQHEARELIKLDARALGLLTYLRNEHGWRGGGPFFIANGMAPHIGMSRHVLRRTLGLLMVTGKLKLLRKGGECFHDCQTASKIDP